MSEVSDTSFQRVLDPMERISETLFGLIMALTFICTLGVATANDIKVHTILIGALGGNLAWGIVDGGLYLLARINEQGDIEVRRTDRWDVIGGLLGNYVPRIKKKTGLDYA